MVDIHPSFSNRDRTAYHRRRLMVHNNIMPEKESKGGGDRLLLDIFHWSMYVVYDLKELYTYKAERLITN